jgi:uncharacterized protein (TIGR02996 family)
MTTREALLAAVYAAPEDDLPRLVFADFLDESGEPERAAFIRHHIADSAHPVPSDFTTLLNPADRDAFEGVSYRPTFTSGFLSGVAIPDCDTWHDYPSSYPVHHVANDWHRLCDLNTSRKVEK